MKVAAIQLTSGPVIADNLKRAESLVRAAASAGAALVSTPETTHLMDLDRDRVLRIAKPEGEDPGVHLFSELASELGLWLHVGSLIIARGDGKLANRSFLFAPDGALAARYDKIHMFDVALKNGERYEESALYAPGDSVPTVRADEAVLGLTICYDLRFAALYRAMAEAGATVILVPAAFTRPTGEAHWHTLLRARAIETGSFVIAAAQTGTHAGGRATYGHALIIDPWGTILADAGEDEGFIAADLDLARVEDVRKRIPVLKSARDFYVDTKPL